MNEILIEYLKEFITADRWELFNKVIRNRTTYITVVLEDIFQPHNASAVLRTCDCFGLQDVHIIENENEYTVNPQVALGSDKWLHLKYHNTPEEHSTLSAIRNLKKQGYRIVATTPHTNDVNLEDFDLTKGKIALMFGTEQHGLSETALENADEFLKIPMHGFTESFNISVSAAIILHYLTLKLTKSVENWTLTDAEQKEILVEWLKISIKDGEKIADNFLTSNRL